MFRETPSPAKLAVKVLLDENPAHRLRTNLGTHEVFTGYKGWAGLRNGELLRTAENDGIEVLMTGDQTFTYEQNLAGRAIAVVALSSFNYGRARLLNPALFARSIAARLHAKSSWLVEDNAPEGLPKSSLLN